MLLLFNERVVVEGRVEGPDSGPISVVGVNPSISISSKLPERKPKVSGRVPFPAK